MTRGFALLGGGFLVACVAMFGAVSPAQAETQPDCGGAATVSWSGGTWQCSFTDEFDGSSLDLSKWQISQTKWTGFLTGGLGETSVCYLDDDTVGVGGGRLNLKIRALDQPMWCGWPDQGFETRFVGGSVTTARKLEQAYGRFEIRAKFNGGVNGIHSAIWLWPANPAYGGWPRSGEIDIAEFYSRVPDRIYPYVHYTYWGYGKPWGYYDSTVTSGNCLVGATSGFHDYALEWSPNKITITVDDEHCITTSWDNSVMWWKPTAPFDKPFFLCLTQGFGVNSNKFDPSQASQLPVTMEVDHVYVWG